MNPVDYFEPARDTIRRVTGDRLVPGLWAWKKVKNTHTPRLSYRAVYNGRQYTIQPRVRDPKNLNSVWYEVNVLPGATMPEAFITSGGMEYPTDDQKRPVTTSFTGLADATRAANNHAHRYP